MKKITYLFIPIVAMLSGCALMLQPSTYQPAPPQPYNDPQVYNQPTPDYNQPGYSSNNPAYDNTPQTDQVFYDELSPYGNWIDYPDYGYVWQPGNVDGDFRPYATNGYWVYSDYGWTWASDYSWGWAAFHYGRWFYDDSYGWLWMPGQEWAPAWVTWGSYGDYYCWAPIAPHIHMRDVAVRNGWNPPANSWNVVQRRRVTQRDIDRYIIRSNPAVINNVRDHITIINDVTNNNNTNNRPGGRPIIYNRGPRVNDVENSTNIRVGMVKVSDNTKPGSQVLTNNQISVYRPAIKQIQQQDNKPAPRNVRQFRPGAGMLKTPPQPRNNSVQDNTTTAPPPTQQGTQQPAVIVPNPYRSTNDNPQQGTQRGNNQNAGQNPNQRPSNNQPNTQPVNQQPNNYRNQPDNLQGTQRSNNSTPNQTLNNNQPIKPTVNPAPNPFRNTPPANPQSNQQQNPVKNAPDNQSNTQPAVNQRPNPYRNPNNNPQPNQNSKPAPNPNSSPAPNPQKNFAPRSNNLPTPIQPAEQPRVNLSQGQNQQPPRPAPIPIQRPTPQPPNNDNKPKPTPPPDKKPEPDKNKPVQ